MTTCIHVEGVGKAYPRFHSRRQALATWLGLRRRDQHWVLRGIDFKVGQGESVGLIGVNGAGKSTLLKMITGTAVPSEGHISISGRIAALLELGMGFHPEFTGRQNVMLAGRMQGLERDQLLALMPAIEDFAEIGEYFDQPVRTYSSGMFVRLAFSVATAVRPEILIVDEALAVGDVYFQHKSFARIRSFREQGTTLLFVSHDPGAIKTLCDRAILLAEGGLRMDGRPDDVLDCYNALIAHKEDQAQQHTQDWSGRSGSGKARIEDIRLESAGRPAQIIEVGAPLSIEVRCSAHEYIEDLSLGFMLKDRNGLDIHGSNTWLRQTLSDLGHRPGEPRRVRIHIPALNIGPGSYSLTLALHSGAAHLQGNHDWWDKAVVFQVVASPRKTHFQGVCALDSAFEACTADA